MDRVFKDLAKRRSQRVYRVHFVAAEEAGLLPGETGALRRKLSVTLKVTLSYRTRICLEKQAAPARRNQVDPGTPPVTTSTPPTEGPATTISEG